MQLKLQNKDLLTIKCVLEKLHIQNMKVNRGKVKFYKHILAKIEEYYQDEQEILKEVAVVDDSGSFAKDGNGNIQLKDGETYEDVNRQLKELSQEEVFLKAGEYEARYKAFFDWMAECEEDLTIDESILVDDLLEQFESQSEKEEK
ncbi:DUF1617 family protein [Streptococcus oralis]|uniref:DUF1617 family protein n=1 Tax=Streptococcus oralis TaxID=1303 RepID=UPI0020C90085|nr:DUF1617 family protein [Streptococcus oralis]MCP9037508.1 DUF1617 family protein [Streptococcus oralis]MCP9052963.1 DUF1617 family protein [Streptococcus oralis]MCP9057994.1 DUF1617 family protein [Streptococcus oralis]MCP9065227.1 DUF1617 family protein [Streptococcus oralis]MCP9069788.1 DUF1617 family protein [Streptococcus oralis]